ncbi:MAG: serine--tRNA ligase, partial [Planctomycetes bacterium]|nr:serine--tRNA ligase [Planctomycetota bacterium]
MLDIRLIREDPDAVREAARRKRITVDLDRLLDLDRRFRALTAERDTIRGEQRKAGKEIAALRGEEKDRRVAEMGRHARRLKEAEAELAETERARDELLAQMPNVP